MKIENLSKNYGGLTVYENFTLDLEEGKVTCILGESGSGKTTLLNCVAGLTDYSGNVEKRKCAYVFQSPRLVPNLTVFQNLSLICSDKNRIADMLGAVRLSDKSDCYPAYLSGGQAQRVSLARAFLYGGDVILLDEPFSSLDLKLKKEISDLFLNLQREFCLTALFVTHNVDEALSLADRIIVIKGGKTVLDLPNGAEADSGNLRDKLVSALVNA
ncbi:MAG: ATP-binding cassette domain-containing protein [Clostridia bacterium]|nr:ATP-binding cassette domain-containing protein [Clostridia bacterium]